ncbi:hypothetical protein BDW71DRAFT_120972 [Aspergillus fruticulosus]
MTPTTSKLEPSASQNTALSLSGQESLSHRAFVLVVRLLRYLFFLTTQQSSGTPLVILSPLHTAAALHIHRGCPIPQSQEDTSVLERRRYIPSSLAIAGTGSVFLRRHRGISSMLSPGVGGEMLSIYLFHERLAWTGIGLLGHRRMSSLFILLHWLPRLPRLARSARGRSIYFQKRRPISHANPTGGY